MTISPHSSISSILPQPTQSSAPAAKPQSPPADTVQLSSAAAAHLKGGDADHDGDSH